MPRLQALTFLSALLIAFTLTNTATANVGPVRLAHRGVEHARMIRRYVHGDLHERQLLDPILDPDGDDATTTQEPTPGGGIIGGIGSGIGGTATTTASTTTEETTTTSTSTTTRQTTITPTPTPTPSTTRVPITVTSIVPGEDSVDPEQQQKIEENRERQSDLTRIPENVRIILIVVASILAGLFIIWTAIRKWKLRSSRSFQNRLAPIDWQPDTDKDRMGAGAGPMTEVGSDKDSIRRNMFASDGPSLAPPAHDFTAGSYSRSASPMPNPYARTPSPAPYRTASPAPYRTASPAPYRTASPAPGYPSNGSGHPVHHGY